MPRMIMRSLIPALAAALLLSSTAIADNYVYILTGQSNSLGAVKGSPADEEMLEAYASKGQMWNGNMVRNTGECFETSPKWQPVVPQLPRYGNLCMGPEYGFSYMMHRHGWHTEKNNKLYIIKASLDGGGNSFWLAGGAAWKSMTRTISKALSKLKGETRVQALLYLQGESDKGDEISQAPERFLSLRERLKKSLKKGSALRYAVAGECATWSGRDEKDAQGNTTAQLMYAMTTGNKDVGWVRTRDLSKITSGDKMGVHYDGKSQITIGARYAYAVAVLENLPLGSVRGDDPSAMLDTPAAWWGDKLPGEEDVAVWDVSAANTVDHLARELKLAGVRVADPFSGAAIVESAGKKALLSLGAEGVALDGGDLELRCSVETRGDQTWKVAPGKSLRLGSAQAPVSLHGSACITLSGGPSSTVELHLSAAPSQKWKLGAPAPRVIATIKGKPAVLKKEGASYELVPQTSS